ncbi:Uncharacterized protein APZ42_002798, partial [Daphnia magna]
HDQAAAGQEGAEGHVAAFTQLGIELHGNADDGADQRGTQHDGQNHLPTQPGTEGGQQLEVAIAHALLAGGQLEQPVDGPEREIADQGAGQGRAQGQGGQAQQGGRQAGPEQGLVQRIGQQ